MHASICAVMYQMALSAEASSFCFFFSSRRRHTRFDCDWSSDVCSSDLQAHRLYLGAIPLAVSTALCQPRKPYAGTAEITRRSEEHTSELQSQSNLVCRLLLEKKKTQHSTIDLLTVL